MKKLLTLLATLSVAIVSADNSPTIFSKDRLVNVYDEFIHEEKEYLANTGLTSHVFPGRDPFAVPANPPPPPFKTGLLPIVLVNDSSYPDDEVYVVVTSGANNGASQGWGSIDISYGSNFGVVTIVPVAYGQSASQYTVTLSQLPRGSTGRVIYLNAINSGLVWFSMGSGLTMPVVNASGQPAIQHASPVDTSSSNYSIPFDQFEVAYVPGGNPPISIDATAVSFFGLPLYGYLAGATSGGSNCGLYQPRSYILSQLASAFSGAVESSEWNKLVLTSGGSNLRCLSPGQSIASAGFDKNYLDNSSSYGYSYLRDLWGQYIGPNVLNMQVGVTVPSTATYNYTGTTTSDSSTFVFTSSNGGPDVTFQALSTGPTYTGCTTYNILEGLNLVNPTNQPVAGTAADAVSKLFEEAIVAGILPMGSTTLSLSYLTSNQANYYKVNSLLTGSGQTTGPWYDLYSKALHALGVIYSFAYDDALWPNVLLGGPFVNNSTYVGIT
ncbi:MAG: hypothetical protein FJZ63_02920, partial [Chlamydiae bacterium]|nr:hypothetical protein [Chlamydiota bacterium]